MIWRYSQNAISPFGDSMVESGTDCRNQCTF